MNKYQRPKHRRSYESAKVAKKKKDPESQNRPPRKKPRGASPPARFKNRNEKWTRPEHASPGGGKKKQKLVRDVEGVGHTMESQE